MKTIGQAAIFIALAEEGAQEVIEQAHRAGFRAIRGKVGSMNLEKVVAAVETAAKREGIINEKYRGEHALYHSLMEALYGVCRGQLALGSVLRTVGLSFSVVRGPKIRGETEEGEWIAVALYGTIGAPIKGFEHEAVGLGVNHM